MTELEMARHRVRMGITPYHSFRGWWGILLFACVNAFASGVAISFAAELGDVAFGVVFGAGFGCVALAMGIVALHTRRYRQVWAPIIARDRAEYEAAVKLLASDARLTDSSTKPSILLSKSDGSGL